VNGHGAEWTVDENLDGMVRTLCRLSDVSGQTDTRNGKTCKHQNLKGSRIAMERTSSALGYQTMGRRVSSHRTHNPSKASNPSNPNLHNYR
jgi:hypothetical protein